MGSCTSIRDLRRRRECLARAVPNTSNAHAESPQQPHSTPAMPDPAAAAAPVAAAAPSAAPARLATRGPAFVQLVHQQHSRSLPPQPALAQLGEPLLGLLPEPTRPRFASSLPPQPAGASNASTHGWMRAHPLQPHAEGGAPPGGGARRLFALCLWGIAGVKSDRSLLLHTHPAAVFEAAHSQVTHILQPAERLGWETAVFAHSWSGRGSRLALAVDRAYAPWLKGSVHEPHGMYTIDRVTSLILSVSTSLSLAAKHAAREGVAFDLVMNARYDLFALRDFDLRDVDPRALTTAVWCTFNEKVQSMQRTGCGSLNVVSQSTVGVSDWWFLGGQTLLEWFWGSLRLRRIARLTYNATAQYQRLSMPDACLNSSKAAREGYDRCEKVHPVIENHAEQLGLKQRGLLRSLNIVQNVHFTLYRLRLEALNVSASQMQSSFFCDSKQSYCRYSPATPPAVLLAEEAWKQQEERFWVAARSLPERTQE